MIIVREFLLVVADLVPIVVGRARLGHLLLVRWQARGSGEMERYRDPGQVSANVVDRHDYIRPMLNSTLVSIYID